MVRKVFGAVAGWRSELLDGAGLGLLATSAFCWSAVAGFAAAGVAVLAFNWRLERGQEG
ncbi:hypothetical protein ABZ490_40180 [Streptomyces sp. NPDC005811]|uniref:hypothetical protein n=1 Tax=Streptomyces sp. NPDC005811 TaxID=3154565 RepID=UPI0033D2B118